MDHKNQHRWHLLFVLPNLVLKEPIECGFVALVPNQDSRLDEARVGASGKLLSSFENPFQKALQPTALITYQSAEERQPLDALLAFRNVVALAALIDEWTKAHRHPGNGGVLYSDWFDLHPFTPSNDNTRIVISSPTTSGASFPDSFRGQCSAAIPYPFHLPLLLRDRTPLNPLLRQWHERLVQKKRERKTTVLFRSLAIAFEAAKFPSNPTLYEIGTRLERLKSALQGEDGGLVIAPLDSNVAEAMERIPRDAIPDMPDRIISATALSLNLPLVTRDGKIKASEITTI